MWAKQAGAWRPVTKDPSTKKAGTWVEHEAMFTKIGGAWHQLVPPNCIVMYAAAAPSGTAVCDGTLGTPNLMDLFPRHNDAKNPLQLDGPTSIHSGRDHGEAGITSDPAGISGASATLSFSDGALPGSPTVHTHPISPHTHSAELLSEEPVPSVSLVPTVGGDALYANAIVPRISSNESIAWLLNMTADPNFVDKYVKFASSFAAGVRTAFDHDHGSGAVETANWTWPTNQKQPSGYSWAYTHKHSILHRMPFVAAGGRDGPVSVHAFAFKVTSTHYFDELPSGSVMLFLSADYPEGWTPITVGSLLRFTTATLDEADEHTHSGTCATGGLITVNTKSGTFGPKTDERVITSHTHTWTDSHTTPVNSIPPSVVLRFAIKD